MELKNKRTGRVKIVGAGGEKGQQIREWPCGCFKRTIKGQTTFHRCGTPGCKGRNVEPAEEGVNPGRGLLA